MCVCVCNGFACTFVCSCVIYHCVFVLFKFAVNSHQYQAKRFSGRNVSEMTYYSVCAESDVNP